MKTQFVEFDPGWLKHVFDDVTALNSAFAKIVAAAADAQTTFTLTKAEMKALAHHLKLTR